MAYTQLNNLKHSPAFIEENANEFQKSAIRFISKRCEKLRFDYEKENQEEKEKVLLGRSAKKEQIPYNMEKDIDRLCLENAARVFLKSGSKEDAFDVYFCFMDMFIGNYTESRNMVEMLSEFENNGSSLLMKHRDHYSHSVYVFLLGLAIYENNEAYQECYKNFYQSKLGKDESIHHHFLQYWGLTSLFHDIGYPFELPFEQVASYFEVDKKKRAGKPFLAYQALAEQTRINENLKRVLAEIYRKEGKSAQETVFTDTNDLFAFDLANKLSDVYCFSRESMREILSNKPSHPDQFGYYMDHGYFSALILFKKLFEELSVTPNSNMIDAMTAIILHNSLYKFSVAYYKDEKIKNIPLKPELHPLAYMLMLCDELQAWDRTSYGRNSRKELHPMDFELTFNKNEIVAKYFFDKAEKSKMDEFEHKYEEWKNQKQQSAEKPKLKAYGDFYTGDFEGDIKKIIDLEESGIFLKIEHGLEERSNSKKKVYLSDSNFIHLFNFAVVLDARWRLMYGDDELSIKGEELEEARKNHKMVEFALNLEKDWEKIFAQNMSLEYKLSNINQAKGFAKLLNEINCFYTDRPVDYDMVQEFTEDDINTMAPLEHRRWLRRNYEMGWTWIKEKQKNRDDRENSRKHYCMIPDDKMQAAVVNGRITREAAKENFDRLPDYEKGKDAEPLKFMLDLLQVYDGLRIYRLPNNTSKND